MRRLVARIGLLSLLSLLMANIAMPVAVAGGTPTTLTYTGRFLDASDNPVTVPIELRFSLWSSGDWVSGDASGGSINTGSATYGGWSEAQTVTPQNGVANVLLGGAVALPTFDFNRHKYLQVEVKYAGQPDTSYQLMDPTGDVGADTDDRKPITSVPFARNAQNVDGRAPGTGSGDLVILGVDGTLNDAQMGDGTNANGFTINADNSAADAALTFGNSLLPATITFSQANQRFEFSTDVFVDGTVTASGSVAAGGDLTINADNAARDAVITFGNDILPETLRYSSSDERFEFSADVRVEGNLTVTGTVNGVDLTSLSSAPLQVSAGAGLTVNVAAGVYRVSGAPTQYAGVTGYAVGDNATTYLYFVSSGLSSSTSGFPTDQAYIPLATVTTSGGSVTGVEDMRALQSDLREIQQMTSYHAPYPGASVRGDATDNVGRLSVSHDEINAHNFYLWTSTQSSLQDYEVVLPITLPEGFRGWRDDPITVQYRGTSASPSDARLDISVFDTNGQPVSLTGSYGGLSSITWADAAVGFGGTPTWTPGGTFIVKCRVSAKDNYQVHLGSIRLLFTELQKN